MVVIIFAVIITLGSVLFTIVMSSYDNSMYYHRQQQAYFTARSVLNTVINELTSGTNTNLQNIVTTRVEINGSGDATSQNMGTYKVNIKKDTVSEKLKVEVIADFQGSASKLTATLSEKSTGRMNPTEFMFFSKLGVVSLKGSSPIPTSITGDVLTVGSLLWSNLRLNGNLLHSGSIRIGGNTTITGNIIITFDGDMTLDDIATINFENDFYAVDGFNLDPAYESVISGIIDVGIPKKDLENGDYGIGFDDDVKFDFKGWTEDYVCSAPNNAQVKLANGSNVNFTELCIVLADKTKISFWDKAITYPGSDTPTPSAGIVKLNDNTVIANFNNNTITFVDESVIDFNTKKLTLSKTGVFAEFPFAAPFKYYNSSSSFLGNIGGDVVVSQDGSHYSKIPSSASSTSFSNGDVITSDHSIATNFTVTPHSTVTIDTTAGDIRLYSYEPTTFLNGTTLNIIGNNNVYIYVSANSNIIVEDNCKIGQSSNSKVQLYFLGEGSSSFSLTGNSTLKGVVYLYEGNYNEGASSGHSNTTKVTGSVTAQEISITSGNKYVYAGPSKAPAYDTTLPSQYFIYPNNISGSSGWQLESYGG